MIPPLDIESRFENNPEESWTEFLNWLLGPDNVRAPMTSDSALRKALMVQEITTSAGLRNQHRSSWLRRLVIHLGSV